MKDGCKRREELLNEVRELRRRLSQREARNELWERAFDAAPDLLPIIDADSRIVGANKAMAERLGLPREECVGRRCYEVVHGTDGPPSYCPYPQLLRDGQEHTAQESEGRLGADFVLAASPVRSSVFTPYISHHKLGSASCLIESLLFRLYRDEGYLPMD